MARKSKKIQIAEPVDVLGEPMERPLEVKSAHLKDMYCNYSYELLTGVGKGDVLTRKGSSIVHDDMRLAFKRLQVHLAIIDDTIPEYKEASLKAIMKNDNVLKFAVSGMEITGSDTNRGVIIHGDKWCNAGSGHISIKTPKIKFDGGYVFLDDLQDAIIHIQSEVEEYMNGKVDPNNELPEFDFQDVQEDEFTKENAI
jgi:hypothetical protein